MHGEHIVLESELAVVARDAVAGQKEALTSAADGQAIDDDEPQRHPPGLADLDDPPRDGHPSENPASE